MGTQSRSQQLARAVRGRTASQKYLLLLYCWLPMDPVAVPAPAPPFSEEQLAWLQAVTGRPLVILTVSDGIPHASGGTLPPLSATPTTPAMPGEQEIGVVTIAGNQLSLPYSTSPHSWEVRATLGPVGVVSQLQTQGNDINCRGRKIQYRGSYPVD